MIPRYQVRATTTYRRDQKRLLRQGKPFLKLQTVLDVLIQGEALDPSYRDHGLTGNWAGHRECHIAPDWLLVYRIEGNDLVLVRTGSHAELF